MGNIPNSLFSEMLILGVIPKLGMILNKFNKDSKMILKLETVIKHYNQ